MTERHMPLGRHFEEPGGSVAVEPYGYASAPPDSCEDWVFIEFNAQGTCIEKRDEGPQTSEALEAEIKRHLEEDSRRSFDAGFEQGLQEGKAVEREAQRSAHAGRVERIAEEVECLNKSFTAERNRYFERAEHEAMKLALAVAARILRREAHMDPLLLLGAVRVALGQIAASTNVRLHVPATDAELWSEAVALLPGRDAKPQVVGEDEMRLGECVVETELGSADLGIRAQLIEIESCFSENIPAAVSLEPAALEQR